MTIIHAKDAKIEFSIDGERWHPIQGAHSSPLADVLEAKRRVSNVLAGTVLSFSPIAQQQAAEAAWAEEERIRMERIAALPIWHSLSCTLTKFNRGMFEAMGGAHTRQSMRHRKIARYIRGARNQ